MESRGDGGGAQLIAGAVLHPVVLRNVYKTIGPPMSGRPAKTLIHTGDRPMTSGQVP